MPGTKFKQLKDKDPDIETYLAKVSKVESGNNPNARNPYGSATGLFQFTAGTWEGLNKKYKLGYTLEDRKNPEKAAKVMRLFTEENEATLKPIVGRNLTDGEKYLAHFMGSGGAKRFLSVYKANPNAPISTVLSAEALKANKGVVYNKDGSLKTVSDIYGWANEKMGVEATPQVYGDVTNAETPQSYATPKLETSSVPLQTSTEKYVEKTTTEPKEVQQAVQDLNEKTFVEELSNIFTQQEQPVAQQEVQTEPDLSSAYNYINIEEYQQGGNIKAYKDSLALYNSSQIGRKEMQSLGWKKEGVVNQGEVSLEELKNQIKTRGNSSVLLGLGNAVKSDSWFTDWEREASDDDILKALEAEKIKPVSFIKEYSPQLDSYYYRPVYKKPKEPVKPRDKVKPLSIEPQGLNRLDEPVIETETTIQEFKESLPTYGSDRFQNMYRAKGTTRPGTGRKTPPNWDEDVEMVWLKDPEELGVDRQTEHGYNTYNDTYKNLKEGVDFIYMPIKKGTSPQYSTPTRKNRFKK